MIASEEFAAQLTLALYLLTAALLIAWQIFSCKECFSAWILYIIERLHMGLMGHFRSNRRCTYPAEGPGLIIANHRGPVDPMMVWMNNHLVATRCHFRIISFMMAKEYSEIPGLSWLCRSLQSIYLGRDGNDMGPVKDALRALKAGKLVAVFPEGRINLGEGLLEGNSGIAWLALSAKVPVFPVFIHGSPQGKGMVDPFTKPFRVSVSYGDPIDLSEYFGQRKTQDLLKEVTNLMMERLADLGGVTYRDENAYSESDRQEPVPMQQATA